MTGPRPLRPRWSGETVPESLSALHPVLARVYAARGVSSSAELSYSLGQLAPVGSLENIDAAVALLLEHRDRHIIIVGDFDVDGATSTALMLRALRAYGFGSVDYLVPNRFSFGYGLTPQIVDVAADQSPSLIVTVDNGISSLDGVQRANEHGIDVLVTDHHLPGAELPEASVIVNPNLPDSRFPSRNLAGVGVAFYVMAALGRQLENDGADGAAKVAASLLDLVALGTVADVVPLDYNNRILVTQGLQRIRAGRTVPGIRALLEQTGRELQRIVSTDLGFAAGPRINAAGRLEDMGVGIECLLTDDNDLAREHAATLDAINRERRDIEASMREQAFRYVDALPSRQLPACVCLYEKDWHQGIVGLVAARVRERCHRPVIAFADESGHELKGSARSIPGVHVRDLLEAVASQHPGLMTRFGGHAMAAGLTLPREHFEAFAGAASEQLQRLYPSADFSGALSSDGALPADALNLRFAGELRDAGPWGSGFEEPLFSGEFEVLEQRTVGENHLKLRVRPCDGSASVDAIAFNQADSHCRGIVQLAYRLDVNEFRGRRTPQLIVEQIAAVTAGSC